MENKCNARHPDLPYRCIQPAGHDQFVTAHETWRGEKWTSTAVGY